MGEFRRQPSKVWWSTYEDEDLSKFPSFLNWGKAVDLSTNLSDSVVKNKADVERPQSDLNQKNEDQTDGFYEQKSAREEELDKKETQRQNLESDRGSSSSPSGGSHKSQDSGFSDSEIQNNPASLSPVSSPELSAKLSCLQCKSKQCESVVSTEKEINYNLTVANYRKLKSFVTSSQPENAYLETAFDCFDGTPNKVSSFEKTTKEDVTTNFDSSASPKLKNRMNLIKNQIARTKCDTREKINQIQNQLELSFKLPKKINLSQNLKLFSNKSQEPTNLLKKNGKDSSSESATSLKSLSCLNSSRTESEGKRNCGNSENVDSEGFRVPKLPAEQVKGGNNLLDLTDIEGPPISSSTPKSGRFRGRDSPMPRTARATEKSSMTKTTFATIRKLKELPEKRLRAANDSLRHSFTRCGKAREKEPTRLHAETSVKHWLSELESMYEAEVMTTLQSKSLATDLTRQVTSLADTTSQTVRKLHQKTKIISSEFSKLCQQNKNKNEKLVNSLVQSLVGHVTDFVKEYVQKKELVPRTSNPRRNAAKIQRSGNSHDTENCDEMITDFREAEPETLELNQQNTKEKDVLAACDDLMLSAAEVPIDHDKIEARVAHLGMKFTEVVDLLLEAHIQALIRVLEEPRTELALRTALSALTSLALEGNHLSLLVSRCGGIRALLAVCLEARATAVRVSALRALATVCCLSDTIRQFEQAGGVEILADILADENRSEAELSEASAVVAQVTAPWVQDNQSVDGLSQFLNSLVTSLTRIVHKYKSSETLLLSSAALANLTFMEPRTVWPLLENQTAKILLEAVRRQGPKVSVFIQEQAATVVANMASIPECRKQLADQRAVVALLCFLEVHHSPLQRTAEVAAAERLQQKSAIALSRLCSDAAVAKQVVELQGVNRLVRLCKEEQERNHSDGVLVACLAALRKIVANCGTEALEELNAMELVEPRLLDSFLLYSSKQESYV